jgi:hypothetical protein
MGMRLGLGELFGAGPRAVSRYTGTLLAVFVVQLLVASTCMLAVAYVLAQTFSHLPLWDDAVDGDLVALITCIRYARPTFLAVGGLILASLLLWELVSWFLIGGLNGVLARRPEGRAETARCFGASGASTYLRYGRLACCSLPGWALVLFVFGACMGLIANRLDQALTLPDLFGPLLLGLLPSLILLHILWTVADYARADLTLRHDTHDPGVIRTYLRALGFVLGRPITLIHSGLGWVIFLLLTLAYAYLASGHPMYGTEGAIMLFVVRAGVSLLRMATRFGILAGQLELGRTRPLPPRRIEKTDVKA